MKYITGIGSRKTPVDIQEKMVILGEHARQRGIRLRSGHADGADYAFELGAKDFTDVYLPWPKFNGRLEMLGMSYTYGCLTKPVRTRAKESVRQFHPNPGAVKDGAYLLMARNYFQVMGHGEEEEPSKLVICWTPDVEYQHGGTSQAVRIALANGIPVINLMNASFEEAMKAIDEV